MLKIANAPVSWGVDFADNPANPPWQEVMDGIAAAGYRYTELGPYGYFPTERAALAEALAARDLTLTAGFLFQPLHDPAQHDRIVALAARTADLLAAAGGSCLVLIDDISSERERTAGRRQLAAPLAEGLAKQMIAHIDELARIAQDRGLTPVLHQHAGTYLEFPEEIEAVLDALPPERLSLCVDSGHLLYAGIDPVAFVRQYGSRVRHVHLKDLDAERHARALADGQSFLDSVGQFVFCPLGEGAVDFPAFATALREIGYSGTATVEQDRDPARPAAPLADARASFEFVETCFGVV